MKNVTKSINMWCPVSSD